MRDDGPRVAVLGAGVIGRVVPMMHLGDRHADLLARLGADRVVRAFPGLGGYIDDAGTVHWLHLGARQPTTIEAGLPGAALVRDVLAATGLALTETADMNGWMASHLVLVGGRRAAPPARDGRGDPRRVRRAARPGRADRPVARRAVLHPPAAAIRRRVLAPHPARAGGRGQYPPARAGQPGRRAAGADGRGAARHRRRAPQGLRAVPGRGPGRASIA